MDMEDILILTMFLEENNNSLTDECKSCHRQFNITTEFDSQKSYREYQLSGLCQECQNQIFKRNK